MKRTKVVTAVCIIVSALAVMGFSSTIKASATQVKVAKPWHEGMKQLGIDLLWYSNGPKESTVEIAKTAQKDIDYIVSLKANSIDIVFPFYTPGLTFNTVDAGYNTPTTSQMALVINEATKAGLRVTLRPLMDQADLGAGWRGALEPTDVTAWFSSYEQFLRPYLVMAQANRVKTFIVGAELNSLEAVPQWNTLLAQAKQLFHGELGYSSNFDVFHDGNKQPPVDRLGVDAYAPQGVPSSVSLAQLEAYWDSWWNESIKLSRNDIDFSESKLVIDEVGIAAQDGAYKDPYMTDFPGESINPTIQINWFKAACQVVQRFNIAGVYYWDVNFYPLRSVLAMPTSFVGKPGADAIKACFTTLSS